MGFAYAQRIEAIIGVIYLIGSLVCCVWYIQILNPSFANDLWWAGYNLTGYEAFLLDLCNQYLSTHSNGSFDVLSPTATLEKNYGGVNAFTDIFVPYMHNQLLGELTSIEYAVPQLRQLSTYWSMRVNVQHCWVDFNKTFEMAHTELRQQRCRDKYHQNAAVHMEAILRNQPWDPFLFLWAGEGIRFNVAIQRGLQETKKGRDFLLTMATAYNTTTVQQELDYWRSYNFTIFKLQWQDRWLPGISETIEIENALGMKEQYNLKALNQIAGPWSSQNLFWIPLNDLYNAMILNRSFVRGTSNYFGANVSATQSAINLEVYRGIANSKGQLTGQVLTFHNNVGPYFSIDCWYFNPPPELIRLYNFFHESLFTQLRASQKLMDQYVALPQLKLFTPTPPTWYGYNYYGGDPMCLYGVSTSFVQQSFDFFDTCTVQVPLSVQATRERLLFSLYCLQSTGEVGAICQIQTDPTCGQVLHAAQAFLAELSFDGGSAQLLPAISSYIQNLHLGIMQFATAPNGSWVVLSQPLLGQPGEANWAFYGWNMLFDWAIGQRQVLSFEGDVGTLVIMSNAYVSQQFTTGDQPLETATKMIYFLVASTTFYLVGVGAIALLYSLRIRFVFMGRNLLYFNRIVGSVWVGRHLMFLRGMSAILLLSTSQLGLVTHQGFTRFEASPRSLISTLIITGEATWVTYCLNEFFVIFIKNLTPVYSPWSSILSWIILLIIELNNPVRFAVHFERKCVGNDIDYGVLCSSGRIQVGDFSRVCILVGVQCAITFLCIIVGTFYRRYTQSTQSAIASDSDIISGPAEIFISTIQKDSKALYDQVTCVLCGLIPITISNKRLIFDLKLWILVADTISIERSKGPKTCLVRTIPSSNSQDNVQIANLSVPVNHKTRWKRFIAFCGLFYMGISIIGSVSYFEVCQVNLANDLYWATFNVTGAHTFFATWLNEQLVLGASNQLIQLDSPSINLLSSFGSSTAFVTTVNNYGAWLQHNELSDLGKAVAGLRKSDACNAPWIFTQYCYVDFNRTWEMAYSRERQTRCKAMATNAAVYLESVLRNLSWDIWMRCWGDAFMLGIGNELKQTIKGQQWLNTVADPRTTLAEEVTYWSSFDMHSFDVQWQNYKRIGMINSYTITNAYGVVYPMPLMTLNGTYRFSSQTTFKMYWAFASDLYAVASNTSGIGYKSLIRSSANFAFSNTTLQAVLTKNLTLMSPLAIGLTLVQQLIGPFGVTDMIYVKVPRNASTLVSSIIDMMRAALTNNMPAQIAFNAITPLGTSYPIPKKWLTPKYYSYGGSPLCQELNTGKPVVNGLISILSFDLPCQPTSPIQSKVIPTRQHYIVSAVLSGLSSKSLPNYSNVCSYDPAYLALCLTYLNQTVSFINTFMTAANTTFTTPSQIVTEAVRQLNIELMIYNKVNSSMPLRLLHTNVLDSSEVDFGFFGWTYLYDWVVGNREAIMFFGDRGNLTILTDLELALMQQVKPWLMTADVAQYCQAAVLYVTFIMLGVSSMTCWYMVASKFEFEGINMFELCRVGGMVWVGRPLLFLRSMTALCLLSTGTFELNYTGYMSYFSTVPTPKYKIVLAAGETTWLVSVVNDIALVFTKEYSLHYTTPNSFLVWISVAILTITKPIQASVTIEKDCYLAEMDFQVVCGSGSIIIGQLERFLIIILIVLLSNILSYCYVRCRMKTCPPCPINSLLLSSRAKYLFVHGHRHVGDIYYIDRASAALDGILTLYLNNTIYSLDIKLWRIFITPKPAPNKHQTIIPFPSAFPLNNRPYSSSQ